MNHILGTYIAGYDENEQITAPPAVMLEVLVIAGVATLRILPGDQGLPPVYDHEDPPSSIDVPARSLVLALQAMIAEEDQAEPER